MRHNVTVVVLSIIFPTLYDAGVIEGPLVTYRSRLAPPSGFMRRRRLGDWWDLVDERRDESGRLLETEVEAVAYTIPKLWEHVQIYIEQPKAFHGSVGPSGIEIDKVRFTSDTAIQSAKPPYPFMAPEYNGDGTKKGGLWSIRFIVTWKRTTTD